MLAKLIRSILGGSGDAGGGAEGNSSDRPATRQREAGLISENYRQMQQHIEPALIDNVLDDLKRVVTGVGTFTVHTGPAVKHLPDGRNAHLIQQPAAWWLPKILDRFELGMYNRLELERGLTGFWVVVEPKRN